MAPKNRSSRSPAPAAPPSAFAPQHTTTSAASAPVSTTPPAASASAASGTPAKVSKPVVSTARQTGSGGQYDVQNIVQGVWKNYVEKTPQRVKLLDTFLGFLVAVGVLQFVYCVLVGNFPFNAFLSGFSATVGQFVLTASLRIQTNPENKAEFASISSERAFADYVLGSLLLHFFCVNFIN